MDAGRPPPEDHPNPATLENQDPAALGSVVNMVTGFLQLYGWYIIFGGIALYYIYSKLRPKIQNRQQQWQSSREYKYNAEETRQRQEAMDHARSRLQEEHAAKADRFAEEQKKKEEQKRQEKLEDWQRHQEGKGYRSKVKPRDDTDAAAVLKSKAKKTVYKNTDYNPMMGSSSGSTYRPARRGASGGG